MNGIDEAIDAWVRPGADALARVVFFELPVGDVRLPMVVLWLAFGALFFTLRFRFINIRGFGHALRLVRSASRGPGEVTHFQALSTAISGTVGIGNIGGVAVVVSLGGAGAAFWMLVAGMLGMSTKFVECTLGVIYRRENADGSVSGGPMYYLERGLGERGFLRLGRALGVFYAVGIVIGCLGIGNMFQSNQASRTARTIRLLAVPIVLAWVAIAAVTNILVPQLGVIGAARSSGAQCARRTIDHGGAPHRPEYSTSSTPTALP